MLSRGRSGRFRQAGFRPSTLAAGLAGINAIANLIGGGLMVNVVGVVKERTGSFVLGMLPLALLCDCGRSLRPCART